MSDDQMLKEHQATWDGFTKLILWSTVAIVITLIILGLWLL
ncbi:MAG: aa3-type cytochrome c oxidase subunit IV [Kiloniellales bacterium]|nr:aa3-type cytochrome c oxidase subunit IV [Kiloniellales bacterium]